MKRFMNNAETMVSESLDGFVSAHADLVVLGAQRKFVRRRELVKGKVGVISGGGAGHEPLHVGFIGHGMLDAACTGHLFTSPTPDQIVAAIEEVDTGSGVLLVVKNYDGDVMNFEIAAELARIRHSVEMVVVQDDISTKSLSLRGGRRGVAGTLVVEKLLGAAAESGMSLSQLADLGKTICERTRTMGVALSGVAVPHTKRASFRLGDDEMEMGVGIHGEPGLSREKLVSADTIAKLVCTPILAELDQGKNGAALLFVNGFGGTPISELYLMYNSVRPLFEQAGVRVARSLVGNYVTSLDMAGASVTLALLDDDLMRKWDAKVETPALRWG